MSTENNSEKLYTFCWKDGTDTCSRTGKNMLDAFEKLGYDRKALANIEHYVETELVKENGEESAHTGPSKTMYVRVCKTCGKTFSITENQAKWFTDHSLQMPTHCPKCIKKRKDMVKKVVNAGTVNASETATENEME